MGASADHCSLFDMPAIYQICVRGAVQSEWADRLEGMSIHLATTDDGLSITILIGALTDQASLAGLLNTLYDLQLTVLSVQRIASASMS